MTRRYAHEYHNPEGQSPNTPVTHSYDRTKPGQDAAPPYAAGSWRANQTPVVHVTVGDIYDAVMQASPWPTSITPAQAWLLVEREVKEGLTAWVTECGRRAADPARHHRSET